MTVTSVTSLSALRLFLASHAVWWPVQLFLYPTLNLWLSHCTRGGAAGEEYTVRSLQHYIFPCIYSTGHWTVHCKVYACRISFALLRSAIRALWGSRSSTTALAPMDIPLATSESFIH